MLRAKRPVLATVLASTLIFTGVAPVAALAQVSIEDRPGEIAMMGDVFIARPTLIGSTVVGAGLWVISLPFSLLGGNVGEAGNALVIAPAKSAFIRCLGCTPAQHESLATKRRADRRERQMANQESDSDSTTN